jgi:hypothetical protein
MPALRMAALRMTALAALVALPATLRMRALLAAAFRRAARLLAPLRSLLLLFAIPFLVSCHHDSSE